MDRFNNILFVVQDYDIHADALNQACSLAHSNQAELTVLVLYPDFPDDLAQYERDFKTNITTKIKEQIDKFDLVKAPVIEFENRDPRLVRAIQYVLKHNHDLLIKYSEPADGSGALNSFDSGLLRKCPCPVWLYRGPASQDNLKILVAVDPFAEGPAGRDLDIKLMQTGLMLAKHLNADCQIFSCWAFEHEQFLRHSPFASMDEDKIEDLIDKADEQHEKALADLIESANLPIEPDKIARHKGKAHDILPAYTKQNDIDIVIMGTVARTGIQGFLIGNTAENLANTLTCSLITLKPNGFVSPVKAYD